MTPHTNDSYNGAIFNYIHYQDNCCSCCAIPAINCGGCPAGHVFFVFDCLRHHMVGHTTTSDSVPRGSPPPHSLQQLTNLLWCVDEIVMVKTDLGTVFYRQKQKSTKSGKNISSRTTPDHLMLAQWQLHTVCGHAWVTRALSLSLSLFIYFVMGRLGSEHAQWEAAGSSHQGQDQPSPSMSLTTSNLWTGEIYSTAYYIDTLCDVHISIYEAIYEKLIFITPRSGFLLWHC